LEKGTVERWREPKIGEGNRKLKGGTVNQRYKIEVYARTSVTAIATTEITGLGIE
jgi:hypothetical protein